MWSVQTTDPNLPYTITGAPRAVKGKILIGNGGAEYPVRGYVSAYDAETGKLDWRFHMTPNPKGEPDGAASDKAMKDFALMLPMCRWLNRALGYLPAKRR